MTQAGRLLSPGLLAAIVITLSVGVASGLQCYWCGPLAEQVHRSRRAPPCASTGHHITVCDPGFPYCAVVATAPSYVESRYCVKVYQDECYPQFCNTTKTWKMTCPCRGDLCNGANGAREMEAFEILEKLVNKTHSRIKKRAPYKHPRTKQGKIIDPDIKYESIDYSHEDQLTKQDSETNSASLSRSLRGISENYTPNPDVPSSASSNLPAESEQNGPTSFDSSTTMIEIQFKQSNPTDSIHKNYDIVSLEIEISPEPATDRYGHDLNMKHNDETLQKNSESEPENLMSSKDPPMKETSSTLATEIVSSEPPTGDSSSTGSSTAEILVVNATEGTTTYTASTSSAVPMVTDFNPPPTATKGFSEPPLVDQTSTEADSKSSIINAERAETPTAEAFLQSTKPTEKTSQISSVETQPPLAESVDTTTETSTTLSTITTSDAPNTSEPSKKRSKPKNKNAAVSIQATVLSIIPGIIISRIMY